jgi:cytochrome c-type biogenesis protein CcmH
MRRWLFLLILALALAAVPVARAQEGTPVISDDEVNEIASQMFCPVCENVPLDVCPTQACHQWRETIRAMLAEGATEEEIKAHFVEQYGDRVLAEPPREGFNWLVYVVPPVAVLIGAVLLLGRMRAWKRPGSAPAAAGPETGETAELEGAAETDYIRRLEEELERRS